MRSGPERRPVAGRLPRRGTDRVEDVVAWVLTVAALLLVVAAASAALGVHARETERAAHGNAVVGGVAAGLGVLSGGGTLLGASWWVVRGLTARRNARRWEREWALVEPVWSRDAG